MKKNDNKDDVLRFIRENPSSSSKEIHEGLGPVVGYATVKRILTKLTSDNLIISEGKGKATTYVLSPSYELSYPIDIERYFEKEIDERQIKENWILSNIKKQCSYFTDKII